MANVVETTVWQMAETLLDGSGVELVDVEYVKEKDWYLRVFIDKPEGIGIEDCQALSEKLEEKLDEADIMPEPYILEVSSPGLDRALKKAADFVRFAGQQAQVKMRVAVDGQRNFSGEILNLENDVVRLRTEGGEVALPLADMDRARLVPVFD